ncbi:MAG: hypothetical protein QM817_14300 [Archangium sp.]
MIALLTAAVLAQTPCTLRGDGRDLPAGAFFVKGTRVGTPAPFAFHHDLAIKLTAPKWAVSISNSNLKLELELAADEPLQTQATRPVRFGVFTLNRGEPLLVFGADRDQLKVGIDDPPRLKPNTPLRTTSPCKVASLTPMEEGSTPKDEPAGPTVIIARGEVPISATPRGEPVGNLIVGDDELGKMVDVRGEAALLFWAATDGVIEGWVPARALSIVPVNYGAGTGMLPGKQSYIINVSDASSVRCPTDVALFALKDATRTPIGLVRAGTPMHALRKDDTNVIPDLVLDGVLLDEGVELAIDAKLFSNCAKLSP